MTHWVCVLRLPYGGMGVPSERELTAFSESNIWQHFLKEEDQFDFIQAHKIKCKAYYAFDRIMVIMYVLMTVEDAVEYKLRFG